MQAAEMTALAALLVSLGGLAKMIFDSRRGAAEPVKDQRQCTRADQHCRHIREVGHRHQCQVERLHAQP